MAKRSAAKSKRKSKIKTKKLPKELKERMKPNSDLFVVGLGASAGGLQALSDFFDAATLDANLVYVVVVHLDRTHVSLLPELLQKHTSMPVYSVQKETPVVGGSIYVIPPNHSLRIADGVLKLSKLPAARGPNLPIDTFFCSLAEDCGRKAVAVVLSGNGSDGSRGLSAIKAEFGMVMAQDQESAKYDGMPLNAVRTGLVDFVLPPREMPGRLVQYSQFPQRFTNQARRDSGDENLFQVVTLLRDQHGHDFSNYKRNTIYRRIDRRMSVHQLDTLSDYVALLRQSESEVEVLYRELLIGVTSFFRDPEAFTALANVLTGSLQNNREKGSFRVWCCGCSSGEEAYSLAILLHEMLERLDCRLTIQIFATDADEKAINLARAGVYSRSIEEQMTLKRLKRYFTLGDDGNYRVKKMIREMLVFAVQNVAQDPPFTRLDLLSCRNLLIYLNSELQARLIPMFHYALKPSGTLFLGASESLGQHTEVFSAENMKWKIFRRVNTATPVFSSFRFSRNLEQAPGTLSRVEPDITKMVESILRASDCPPCAIVDGDRNLLYIHGNTGRYLEPPQGRVSINILEMARVGIRHELAAALRSVTRSKQELVRKGLQITDSGGDPVTLDLVVRPFPGNLVPGSLMISFLQVSPSVDTDATFIGQPFESAAALAAELENTRETLQTTIEELETSVEELKSSNEELQSTNEELQSTNEELETSKEELQSLIEESSTVNAELQHRIDEVSRANDDLKNLLDSTSVATIFLNTELQVTRFTPEVTALIPLINTDLLRPIQHFASQLEDLDLYKIGIEVLNDLVPQELEATRKDGNLFRVRIRPYRTVNNVVEGVVATFDDITERTRIERAARVNERLFRAVFENAEAPMLLIESATGAFRDSNEAARRTLGYDEHTRLEDLAFEQVIRGTSLQDIHNSNTDGSSVILKTELIDSEGRSRRVPMRVSLIQGAESDTLLCTWTELDSQH